MNLIVSHQEALHGTPFDGTSRGTTQIIHDRRLLLLIQTITPIKGAIDYIIIYSTSSFSLLVKSLHGAAIMNVQFELGVGKITIERHIMLQCSGHPNRTIILLRSV